MAKSFLLVTDIKTKYNTLYLGYEVTVYLNNGEHLNLFIEPDVMEKLRGKAS